MDFVNEITSQGRRALVDLLHAGDIERSSPWSPEVPLELRHSMPDLFDRFPITWPWEKAKPVDPALHTAWILDNTAFRTPGPDGGQWKAEFVAAYFWAKSGKDISRVVATIADYLDLKPDDYETRERVAKRLQPFVDAVLPKRTLEVSVDGKEELVLGPSSLSGISSAVYDLNVPPTQPQVQTTATNLPCTSVLPSTTVFANPTGWGIISDIDDTIKITQTPSPTGILNNTFCIRTPQPVAGMPELYIHLRTLLQDPAFFYLSASPYNLYTFLHDFRAAHYPPGTIILRDASWQNLGGLISSLSVGTQEYKADRMRKIHSWFPERKFICIGDSTQSDPEAYAEIARKFPGFVGAIFIRRVTGIAEMNEREKNSNERFEKAFRGLEQGLWHVFDQPAEVAERIGALVG